MNYINKMMSNKILQDSVIAFATKIFGATLGFILSAIIARSLGAEKTGEYYVVFSVFMYICALGSLGFNFFTLRIIESNNSNFDKVNSLFSTVTFYCLLACIILSMLLFNCSDYIAGVVFNNYNLSELFRGISFGIPFYVLLILHSHAIQGVGKTHKAMIISGPLIHLIFLFYWFGIGDKNLNSVVSANVFSYAICFFIGVLFWFSRKESQFNSPNYPVKEILASSIPLLITQIFAQINSLSGEILTGALSEPSQVAFFSIANKIATITAFVLIAVNRAVSAKYASLYSDGNIIELQSVVTTSSRIMLIGGGGLIFLIFVFSNSLLNVFGEEFLQAKGVLFVLLFAQLINILTGSVSYLLSMTGHEKIQTKIVMMSSLTMVVLSLLLIPKLGAIGASFSLLFSMTMNNVLGWYYVREIVGINTLKIF